MKTTLLIQEASKNNDSIVILALVAAGFIILAIWDLSKDAIRKKFSRSLNAVREEAPVSASNDEVKEGDTNTKKEQE